MKQTLFHIRRKMVDKGLNSYFQSNDTYSFTFKTKSTVLNNKYLASYFFVT